MQCFNHLSYACNSSNLEPMMSERHGPDEDEEELTVRVQEKGGRPGRCLFLLLVIFAIIASKFYIHNHSTGCVCCYYNDNYMTIIVDLW